MIKEYITQITFPIMCVFMVGCDTSTSTSTSTTSTTYSVTGTVPGTIIEAFCTDGSYYSVNSTDNGTSEHPFELKLPIGIDCKIVAITNEDAVNPDDYIITPIEIESSNGDIGSYVTIDKDIQLGNIPVDTPNVNQGWSPGVRTPLRVTSTNEYRVRTILNDPMDEDNDGIPNIYEDPDGDGKLNRYDDDDDNDGTLDKDEISDDRDGDGIKDIYDRDDDNDGIRDNDDDDDDNDGIKDSEDEDHHDEDEGYSNKTITLPVSYTLDDGKLLGSQCAQCHGTNGYSSNNWDSLEGESGLYSEMRGEHPLMDKQAQGYTETEVLKIENWLKNK